VLFNNGMKCVHVHDFGCCGSVSNNVKITAGCLSLRGTDYAGTPATWLMGARGAAELNLGTMYVLAVGS
jgi:hypothetical protein